MKTRRTANFKSSNIVYPTALDIQDNVKTNTIDKLQSLLVLLIDLRQVVRTAHWNIKGINFISYHTLLDEVQSSIDSYVDEVAEKVVTLGGIADGEVTKVNNDSALPTANILSYCNDGLSCLREVNSLLAITTTKVTDSGNNLNSNGDPVNSNYLIDLAAKFQKLVYLVEQHLR